jgi:hypothetical protein
MIRGLVYMGLQVLVVAPLGLAIDRFLLGDSWTGSIRFAVVVGLSTIIGNLLPPSILRSRKAQPERTNDTPDSLPSS